MPTAPYSKPRRLVAPTFFAMLAVAATMLLVLAASCSTTTPPVGPSSVRSAAPPPVRGEMPELSQGPCGGFTDLPLATPVSMLGDRVRIPTLEGATDADAEKRLDALLSPESMEWLGLKVKDVELEIRAVETYRRPGSDLFAGVLAQAEGAAVAARPTPAGELVIRFLKPPEPPTDHEEAEAREREEKDPNRKVPLFDAFVRTRDRMVIELRFFVRKSAADQGGCERVALRIAEAATGGSRALSMQAGAHQVFEDLAIDVPADHAITVKDEGHFGTYVMVHRVVDIGADPPFLMFWFDRHAGRRDIGELPSTTVTAPAYGAPAEWRQWKSKEGKLWRDVMLDKGPTGRVLIAIGGDDLAMVESLGEIAGSLTQKAVKPTLPACSSFPKPGPATKPREDEHLETLLGAKQLALDSQVWGARRPRELDAFRAIAMRPHDDRAAAFRHLAEHGTPAGRIYGLAGLYLADPASFNSVLCAVRGELTGSVSVGLECGAVSKQISDLVESNAATAIRGEPFWSGFQFWRDGAADLRGGALAYRIWSHAIRGGQSEIAPDGYVPVVTPGAVQPAPLTAGTAASTKIAYGDASLCFTRQDGRVVCVGEVWAMPKKPRDRKERVFLMPDMVRFPADFALGGRGVCVLDAKGRRACVGGLERALEWRADKCEVPVPNTHVYRIFEDGPWSRLVTLGEEACGIRQSDRALYCFSMGRKEESVTKWVEEGQGLFRPYRIPIEGRVVGAGMSLSSEGDREGFYAFTEDGALWEWNHYDLPTIAGKFEAPVERIAHVGGTDFVTLSGGKVFARGLASDKDPFARGDRAQKKWIEIGSLRGSRIHASVNRYHQLGCSLDANGKAGCWGDCRDGVLGRECCKSDHGDEACKRVDTLETVPSLQRSTELHLASYLTCGRTSATTLSCMGKALEWMLGKDGTRGAVTLDLAALGRTALELPPPDRTPTPPDFLARIRGSSTLGQ